MKMPEMTPMTPEQVISNVTYCSSCAAHDDHDHCTLHWSYLQAWMESVEARLAAMENPRRAR